MLTELPENDFINKDFSGLSQRVWLLARLLKTVSNVDILVKGMKSRKNEIDQITVISSNGTKDLKRICKKYDLVYIFQSSKLSSVAYKYAISKAKNRQVIVDCYTPLLFEKATYACMSSDPAGRLYEARKVSEAIWKKGTQFLCASQYQKHYLIGELAGKRGSIPEIFCIRTYMGKIKPQKLSKSDKLVWFGGVYPWMDMVTFLQAINIVYAKDQSLKVDIIGPKFKKKLGFESIWENISLKINTKFVKVLDWMEKNKAEAKLCDYSLAINWAKKTPEDILAYRSRLISLLLAGIPILTNGDDEISCLIQRFKAGVKLESVKDLSMAIIKFRSNYALLSKMSANCGRLVKHLNSLNQIETANWLRSLDEDKSEPPNSSLSGRVGLGVKVKFTLKRTLGLLKNDYKYV